MRLAAMKPILLILVSLTTSGAWAASAGFELAVGRAYYTDGEFRKAANYFSRMPDNPEACYWAGLSYERLADLATPFGGRKLSKARMYLARAARLAPGSKEYRQALFDVLLDSSALREAAALVRTIPESDAEYPEMRRRLEAERQWNSSPEARLSRAFLAGPRTLWRVAAFPIEQ
jgi:hypothetical protein